MKTKIEQIGGKKKIIISYKSQHFTLDYKGETLKEIKWYKSMFDVMIHSFKADLLNEYNEFLLKNQYTDCDIISEKPTALDQFLILDK